MIIKQTEQPHSYMCLQCLQPMRLSKQTLVANSALSDQLRNGSLVPGSVICTSSSIEFLILKKRGLVRPQEGARVGFTWSNCFGLAYTDQN